MVANSEVRAHVTWGSINGRCRAEYSGILASHFLTPRRTFHEQQAMTSKQSPDPSATVQATPTEQTTDASAPAKKAGVSGFASLFSAAALAAGKNDDQPWHQKGNKSAHEKKIGPAPNGTRRSMGKR